MSSGALHSSQVQCSFYVCLPLINCSSQLAPCKFACDRYEDEFVVGRAESFTIDVKPQPFEEENQHLREAVSALRAAVRTERGRREGVERECTLLLAEFSRLQTRVQVRIRMGQNASCKIDFLASIDEVPLGYSLP